MLCSQSARLHQALCGADYRFPAIMMLRGWHRRDPAEVPPAKKEKGGLPPNIILIIYDELPLPRFRANGLIDKKRPKLLRIRERHVAGALMSGSTGLPYRPFSGQTRENGVPATYKHYPENISTGLAELFSICNPQPT
jgi:hypothetical protein